MAIISAREFAATMPDATQLLSDEPEMETSLHFTQLALLVAMLDWWWRDREDYFIGANLTIYFSREQMKNRDFRGPDFFLVKNVQKSPRNSWVVWEEGGKYPDIIIELLSDSTEEIDREIKLELYQERFRTPEYFWFSPFTLEFVGWRLVDGIYQLIQPNKEGRLWSAVLDLYLGVEERKLRYFTPQGEKVASPEEDALINMKLVEMRTAQMEQETQRANRETQRANQEAQRAERLAAKLRALGVDPDSV